MSTPAMLRRREGELESAATGLAGPAAPAAGNPISATSAASRRIFLLTLCTRQIGADRRMEDTGAALQQERAKGASNR